MATSEHLRANILQHQPKNTDSKYDDKDIYHAMKACVMYLQERFKNSLNGKELVFDDKISYRNIIDIIRASDIRKDFDDVFGNRTIKPDGGIITLRSKNESEGFGKIVLVSEVKKQGTNNQRIKEGKEKQAQGNAIERLGKNLAGIRAMMNHENITPFVCFGWGCDFKEKYSDDFVMAKISMMNQFYELNKIYVFKRDGKDTTNSYDPVSMFFREERWTREEMLERLIEIGETSLRYYLY